MNEKINDEAVKQAVIKAISGPGNHACRNDPDGMCPVTAVVSNDMIFVNNRKYSHCPHYVPFGYEGFCNFPPRKELYQQYGV